MTITTTEIRRIFLRHDTEKSRHLQQNAPEFAQHWQGKWVPEYMGCDMLASPRWLRHLRRDMSGDGGGGDPRPKPVRDTP